MNRRERALEKMAASVDGGTWTDAALSCFEILYGLPADQVLGVVQAVLGRYLPVFEAHWPDARWMRELVNAPSQWIARFGRALPDAPHDPGPADAAFKNTADGLLLAVAFPSDPLVFASSSVFAINAAIDARVINVWIADDPEAAALWSRLADATDSTEMQRIVSQLADRTFDKNAAATAVARREWQALVDLIRRADILAGPDAVDPAILASHLRQWKESEMCLMSPGP